MTSVSDSDSMVKSAPVMVPVSAASSKKRATNSASIRWDTVVVGGGVMGLMTALTLADRGQRVGIVDAGRFGGEASWSAGGILLPLDPWNCTPALSELLQYSLRWMPTLCERLRTETQVSPELIQSGIRILNLQNSQYQRLLDWASASNIPVVANAPLEASESAHERLALLNEDMDQSGPDEHQALLPTVYTLRPPRLLKALVRCLRAHPNVGLYSCVGIERIALESQSGSQVVRLSDGSLCFEADNCVLAAGSWTGKLAAQLGWAPPITPVQGQMLLLKFDKPRLKEVILSGGNYLIPRADGRILVGSTVEYNGFEKTLSQQGYETLFAFAQRFLPDITESCIEAQWNGLRPSLESDTPLIGHHPLSNKVWFNTGHHRSGIALSIGSARLLADMIQGRTPILKPELFAPQASQGAVA